MSQASFVIEKVQTDISEMHHESLEISVSSIVDFANISIIVRDGDVTNVLSVQVDLQELYDTVSMAMHWRLDREMEQGEQ